MADFEQVAHSKRQTHMAAEFWYFVKHSKKWWLGPILIVLLMFGLLMVLSGTAAAPFIYTLF